MGYITEIKVQCIKQDDHLGHDDLEFKVDDASIGHVSIAKGETKDVTITVPVPGETQDVPGTTAQFDNAFIDVGQVLSVWVDHLMHSDDLLLRQRLRGADLHNGLHATSASSCDCTYVFDFTFDPSISAPYHPRPSSGSPAHHQGVFSHLSLGQGRRHFR